MPPVSPMPAKSVAPNPFAPHRRKFKSSSRILATIGEQTVIIVDTRRLRTGTETTSARSRFDGKPVRVVKHRAGT